MKTDIINEFKMTGLDKLATQKNSATLQLTVWIGTQTEQILEFCEQMQF